MSLVGVRLQFISRNLSTFGCLLLLAYTLQKDETETLNGQV